MSYIGDAKLGDVVAGPGKKISRIYVGDPIVWARDPEITHTQLDILGFTTGDTIKFTVFNRSFTRILKVENHPDIRVVETGRTEVDGFTQTQYEVTATRPPQDENGDTYTIKITFDDMATVDITVTQEPPAALTSMTVVVGSVEAGLTAEITHHNPLVYIRVTGEVGASYRLTKPTDGDNIATVDTSTVFVIPASGTNDTLITVANNDSTSTREFTVGVAHSVTDQTLGPATITQAADGKPSINITDPGTQNLGTAFTLAAVIADGDSPFTTEFSTTPDFSSGNITAAGTGANPSVSVTMLTTPVTYYARATDLDGDVTVVDSQIVNATAVAGADNGSTASIAWDATSMNIVFSSTVGNVGSWNVVALDGGTSGAATYNNVTTNWEFTSTVPINSGVTGLTRRFRLDYTNSSYTTTSATISIAHNARPLVLDTLAIAPPVLSAGDTSVSFTVQHDITKAVSNITDGGGMTDDDFLVLTSPTLTNITTGIPATVNAVGSTTVPGSYAARTQITLTCPTNATADQLMDMIVVNIN